MTTFTKFLLVAVLILGGCGSSGSDDGVSESDVSFSDLQDRAAALEAEFGGPEFDDIEATALENIPTTGSASYTGLAVVVQEDDTILDNDDAIFLAVGNAEVTAEFGDLAAVTGTADSFFQSDDPNANGVTNVGGTAIEGALTFSLDQELPTEVLLLGEVSGALTPLDGDDIIVDNSIIGAFINTDASGIIASGSDIVGNIVTGTIILATED